MNEEKEVLDTKEERDGKSDWYDGWFFVLLFLFTFWNPESDNLRINELEKKIAKLEGQMSMIGGKNL